VRIVGPLLIVIIAIVIIYFVGSFILFRIERQIRRRNVEKQSTGSASLVQRTIVRRMLAYALPYNVLDFKKVSESQSESQLYASSSDSQSGSVQGTAAHQDQSADNDAVGISEPCGTSEKSGDFQELAVPLSQVYASGSSDIESKFLEQATRRREELLAKVRSPVKQTKYLLKKMKKRRIRPFSNKEEKPGREEKPSRRDEDLGEDGFSSCGSGVHCIHDSFEVDSSLSATSTFRMKMDHV